MKFCERSSKEKKVDGKKNTQNETERLYGSDTESNGRVSEEDECVLFEMDNILIKDSEIEKYEHVPLWMYCLAASLLVVGILSIGMLVTGTESILDAAASVLKMHDVHSENESSIKKALAFEYKIAREKVLSLTNEKIGLIPSSDFLADMWLDYCENEHNVVASLINKYGMSPTGQWYGAQAENMLRLPSPNTDVSHYKLLIGPAIRALENLTANSVTHVVATSNYYDVGRAYVWESTSGLDNDLHWANSIIPQWQKHWSSFIDFLTSTVVSGKIAWRTVNLPDCESAKHSDVKTVTSPWLMNCKRVEELNQAGRILAEENPLVVLVDFENEVSKLATEVYLLGDNEHLNRKYLSKMMESSLRALGLNLNN